MDSIILNLRSHDIKAVVLDFDNTITLNSNGRVRKEKVPAFCSTNISPCIQQLLPILLREQFQVGIATFSDSSGVPATHLAGRKLVRAFLHWHFGAALSDRVAIVAACPANHQTPGSMAGLATPMPPFKQFHLESLAARWALDARVIVLIDDCAAHIAAARRAGHPAALVRAGHGACIDDLLRIEPPLPPPHAFDAAHLHAAADPNTAAASSSSSACSSTIAPPTPSAEVPG
jgi:hypothetical protein